MQMLTITSQSSARNDRKAYFMVDIEADGQSPAVGSMIELGCVLVDDPSKRFTVFMRPNKESYSEKSLSISGKTREETMTYPDPKEGMEKFRNWILETSGGRSPIFVSDNGFDWNFVDYYFHKYLGSNPFGYSPRNLHDLHKGFRGSLSSRLSDERGNLPHAAVEDAAMNATHMQRLIDEGLSH
jgi:DNA polymerase III epsilon subunit-like protein